MRYVFLLFFLLACGGDNFKKVEKLEGFRVLGIVADNPEVAPGGSTSVRVLVSDVGGSSQFISGTYELCVDPGISRGAEVSCQHDPSAINGNFSINMANLTPTSTFRTGLSPVIVNVNVPSSILTGRNSRYQFNGVGYLVIFKFTVNSEVHTSFKRIVATNRGSFNTNPSGSTLLLGGAPIGRAPVDGDELSVTSSAPESYSVVNVDGAVENRQERYEIAWYTSVGKFNKPKAFIDEVVEYEGDSGSSLTVAVIRDERGGLDFVTYE